MIDRIAALADIVAPRAVARPPAGTAWSAPLAWGLAAALLLLAGFALAAFLRLVRRGLARRRLRRLAARLRGDTRAVDIEAVLPGAWSELRRAGFDPRSLPPPARAQRRRLLYARRPSAEALLALLEALKP